MDKINAPKTRINSLLAALFIAETNVCATIANILPLDGLVVLVMAGLVAAHLICNKKIGYSANSLIAVAVIGCQFVVAAIVNGIQFFANYVLYFGLFGVTAFLLTSVTLSSRWIIKDLLVIYAVHLVSYFLFDRTELLSSDRYWSLQMGTAYGFTPAIVLSIAVLLNRRSFRVKSATFGFAVADLLVGLFVVFVDCGTRGAWITIALAVLLLVLDKVNFKKYWKFLLAIAGVGLLVLLNIKTIAGWLIDWPMINKIPAVGKMLRQILYGDITSGRLGLYGDALKMFCNRWLLGNGIGALEARWNNYAHQLFLDVLCAFGIVGFAGLMYILAAEVISFIRDKKSVRRSLRQFVFAISIFPLLFSNSFWMLPQFWFMFFYVLHRREDIVKRLSEIYRSRYGKTG